MDTESGHENIHIIATKVISYCLIHFVQIHYLIFCLAIAQVTSAIE